ncbi:hypothetical protein [Streptomyces abyssomicinicus]|uniref:hypothetical protein n=1 Tax=Streptomyces abyssomicinicus TaxID=574929 RepID=UPI00125044A7|nr:hypothetical protein [Streptomyces abyssomicinicus]
MHRRYPDRDRTLRHLHRQAAHGRPIGAVVVDGQRLADALDVLRDADGYRVGEKRMSTRR